MYILCAKECSLRRAEFNTAEGSACFAVFIKSFKNISISRISQNINTLKGLFEFSAEQFRLEKDYILTKRMFRT